MNVASRELSQELYNLSGWKDTDYHWYEDDGWFVDSEDINGLRLPAYDLGFILRKLPPNFHTGDVRGAFEFFLKVTTHAWFAGYNKPESGKWLYDNNHGVWERPCEATTPENAACKLAIELFKNNILTQDKE